VLVDTSVWADHIRRGNARLAHLLNRAEVVTHEFVVGELLLGFVRRSDRFVRELGELPRVPTVAHDEAVELVRAKKLEGSGVGWVDVHVLAAALAADIGVWSLDRPLVRAAARAGIEVITP
jgi:predicted nucleic acid-binding protein